MVYFKDYIECISREAKVEKHGFRSITGQRTTHHQHSRIELSSYQNPFPKKSVSDYFEYGNSLRDKTVVHDFCDQHWNIFCFSYVFLVDYYRSRKIYFKNVYDKNPEQLYIWTNLKAKHKTWETFSFAKHMSTMICECSSERNSIAKARCYATGYSLEGFCRFPV